MKPLNPTFNEETVCYEDFVAALRPKELECLCLRCEGRSLKAIGDTLEISEFTVRNYMTSIFNKTGIRKPLILCQIFQTAKRRTDWNNRSVVKRNVEGAKPNPEICVDQESRYRSVTIHRNVG